MTKHKLITLIAMTAIFALLNSVVGPGAAPAQAQGGSIRFSTDSMVTNRPLQIMITSLVGGAIHYTTNGSPPNANSAVYAGPITVDKTTVIRAQVFRPDGGPIGNIYTRSYIFPNYNQTIPVMSIAMDWGDFGSLEDNSKMRGREWERPINVEYFEPGGRMGFNELAGIRMHGNFSRLFSPKKSYRIYFRKEYGGPGKLDYPLFPDTTVTKFDKLVLRAGFQDTFFHRNIPLLSDKHHTARYINDQVVRNLHRDMGQPAAHGSWVLLYINGEFWGLYNLTERIDLDFLQSYSEKDSQWDVISKESGWDEQGNWYSVEEVKEGGYGAWLDNQNWVGSADFFKPESIGGLEWRVDMENVFSYMFLEAYAQNVDWPDANWIVYRRVDPNATGNDAKWRLMVWDAETTFGAGADNRTDMNLIERVHSPHDSITRMLEKPFIGNCALKVRFWERGREYLGVDNPHGKPAAEIGQLSKERVKAEILTQAAIVRPFIPLETQRWAPDLPGADLFEQNIQASLKFADERQAVILHHLDELRNQTFTQCR